MSFSKRASAGAEDARAARRRCPEMSPARTELPWRFAPSARWPGHPCQPQCGREWRLSRFEAMPTSVLIVDDHNDFRASARALLELKGFEVIGGVEDGEAALEAVARLRPDVVLLDIQLPGIDGFEVAARLAAADGPPRVVLISSRHRTAYEARLPRAPIAGFLGKHELTGAALAALL